MNEGKKKGNKDMASFQSFHGLTYRGQSEARFKSFLLEKSNRTCLLILGKICLILSIEMIFKVTFKYLILRINNLCAITLSKFFI